MLGARFTGVLIVDGTEFHNDLIAGVADNNKHNVIKALKHQVDMYMVPKWMAEHNVTYRITDRLSNKTINL